MQVIDNKNILKCYIGDKQVIKKYIGNQLVYGQPDFASYYNFKTFNNYTVAGSPTIVDGVASGFSRNDYLSIAQSFPLTTSDWEMHFNATTTPNNAQQRLIDRKSVV